MQSLRRLIGTELPRIKRQLLAQVVQREECWLNSLKPHGLSEYPRERVADACLGFEYPLSRRVHERAATSASG